jgi:GNAT superfamily N-acetyltransferase
VNIRLPTSDDLPVIADLLTQLGYPTESNDPGLSLRLEAILHNPEYLILVADGEAIVRGLIIGHLIWFIERPGIQAYLLAMVVEESLRGQGIGEALVDHFEAWCREHDAHTVTLTSRHWRKDAHRFYERLGYESTGIRLFKALN